MKKATAQRTRKRPTGLPLFLQPLFWEYDFKVLSWEEDWELVTGRILSHGGWKASCWLRRKLSDDRLREYILDREGRGLSSRQICYWELILKIPHRLVTGWLKQPARLIWERRVRP